MKRLDEEYQTEGTSFHHCVINTTPNKLIKVLGQPASSNNNGEDKVNMEWCVIAHDGSVGTVYDWKEGAPLELDCYYDFHIGSFTKLDSLIIKHELAQIL